MKALLKNQMAFFNSHAFWAYFATMTIAISITMSQRYITNSLWILFDGFLSASHAIKWFVFAVYFLPFAQVLALAWLKFCLKQLTNESTNNDKQMSFVYSFSVV